MSRLIRVILLIRLCLAVYSLGLFANSHVSWTLLLFAGLRVSFMQSMLRRSVPAQSAEVRVRVNRVVRVVRVVGINRNYSWNPNVIELIGIEILIKSIIEKCFQQ